MRFRNIVGSQKIKEQLLESVKNNRISHSQLFFGPSGNEKILLALAYAQYINCIKKTSEDSCGSCSSCIKHQSLSHPDLHFIFPVLNTKEFKHPISENFLKEWREVIFQNPFLSLEDWIETLKLKTKNTQLQIYKHESEEIQKKIILRNYEAKTKVFFIWLPEKMNTTAANKLLKTIEEPTKQTVFLMVSENIKEILPTIKSRTQLIRTKKPTLKEAQAYLKPEEKNIDQAYFITDGNVGKILRLQNENFSTEQYLNNFISWMRACYKIDIQGIAKKTNEISQQNNTQQTTFLEYAIKIIRDCLIYNYSEKKLLQTNKKEQEFIKKFARFIHGKNSINMTEKLEETIRFLNRNANSKILFFELSLSIAKLLQIKSTTIKK